MPVTFFCFLICSLALAGLPGFSGFLSKDAILINAHVWATELGGGYFIVEVLALATVILTAFYIMRAVFLVFTGEFRLPGLTGVEKLKEQIKEGNRYLTVPAMLLTGFALSIVYGFTLDAEHSWVYELIKTPVYLVPQAYAALSQVDIPAVTFEGVHSLVSALSIGLALAGLLAAYLLYKPGKKLSRAFHERREPVGPLAQLSFYHWYQDALYRKAILKFILLKSKALAWFDTRIVDGSVNGLGRSQVVIAHISGMFDRYIIDGFVHLTALISRLTGRLTRSVQTGNVQTYILSAIVMLIILLIWFAF